MFKSKSTPFDEDIEKATHENNLSEDWALIMHICDNAINFDDGAKYCFKAIIKRLYHTVPVVVLQALTLLDACVKNCDRRFLLQVASSEFTSEVRKLLPKMHPSASDKLKGLLQRWSLEEFKDDSELCIIPALYYKLKSEGVEFPPIETKKNSPVLCTNPDGVSSQEEEEDIIKAIEISLKDTGRYVIPDEFKNIEPVPSSESFSEPMKVRALYDFDAAEDNELTIKTGEIVVVLDSSNTSWWKGSNHRGEGLFPSNFVTKDLDSKPEELTVSETVAKSETDAKVLEEIEVKLDEKKIELVVDWLNDTDPTAEMTDPEDMLLLEKQCYAMTPIIEENLQAIDNRLAKLNLVNEKIMAAFDLFHSLSDISIPSVNQQLRYFPSGTLNQQHIVQFPHPQVNSLPPGTSFYPAVQTSVPQPILSQVSTAVPSSSSQASSLPVTTVQTSAAQEPPNLPSSVIDTTTPQRVAEVSQSIQTTASITTATALPFTQAIPGYNISMPGGYMVPSQAIPYTVQCGSNMQQPGYIQNPSAVPNVMTFPYAIPQMRPYFPFQYYYVDSNLPQSMPPSTSTETVQPSEEKSAIPSSTTTSETVSNTSIPVVSNYSSDLHSLNIASSSSDNPVTTHVLPGVPKEQISSDASSS